MKDEEKAGVKAAKQISWNWRDYFSSVLLDQGKTDEEKGLVDDFHVEKDGRSATAEVRYFDCFVQAPASYLECENYIPWQKGFGKKPEYPFFGDTERTEVDLRPDSRFRCSCSIGLNKNPCRHVAALLIHWEKACGKFTFTETEEEIRIREEREAEEEKRHRIEEEIARKRQEMKAKQKDVFPVGEFYKDRMPKVPGDAHFDPETILKDATTDRYETEIAEQLQKNPSKDKARLTDMAVSFNEKGQQSLKLSGQCADETVQISMTGKEVETITCSCGRSRSKTPSYYWNSKPVLLCAHALLVFEEGWRRIVAEKPGDETDRNADMLLSLLADGAAVPEEEAADKARSTKSQVVTLTPKITEDKRSGKLQLSFQIGRAGERSYALRNLQKLVYAVENEKAFELSKKAEIDFSEQSFTANAARWYQFIVSRVREMNAINARIEKKTSSYYYYGGDATLTIGSAIPLEGSDLDLIYDLAEGEELLCAYGDAEPTTVKVGPGRVRASISLQPARGRNNVLIGIDLSGSIPRFLQGNQHRYILDREQFGRVSAKELRPLAPYQKIADKDGNFRCRIGLRKFPEFYYRVLPALRESRDILLTDGTAGLKLDFLPPEGEYVFYIDYAEDGLSCRPEVRYGKETFPVGFVAESGGALRDWDQERRVSAAVEGLFPKKNESEKRYEAAASDEQLMHVLKSGVSLLEKYGEVRGSDSFRKVHVRPAPQPRFSVQIEGGMLELSVRTKDMTADELLKLLESYHKKKRWVRLKSGDFVDLEEADSLKRLDEFAGKMDISLKDLVKKGVSVPKYRALYVDKLLEEHDEVATSRDKYFKALVRSFRTIQDSDFEVAENLTDTVRPYQLYGFRWLSTLAAAGFGGILADEMGLGKTLQMLAYLLSQKSAGENRPALVVCPASLVYNWKEEADRFAPGLTVELLAGGIASRRESFRQMAAGTFADLYVTSYDLLKRDITNYEKTEFSCICLDEAQYIKNQKTAMAKAVKVLKAEHRFAMTGTPIENRLAELWSIFDFLMPGFLYSAAEFGARFEGPIMKNKDAEATERLAKMTGPFILRRKKADVLKDLPDKLEEVQSCPMEEDQRRLYDAQVVHMRQMLENFAGTGEEKLRVLAEITRLRQICCDPSLVFEDYEGSSAKRAGCLELVERAIDGGHRMLLFSQFTSMLDILAKDLAERKIPFFTLTGSTPKQERLRLVNEFNGGDVPVFLISLKAGGTGLNLVGADVVIHYDPWWNVAVQNQATDRAHRIGQTRQVTVMKMVAVDTIEEKIIALQEAKREMADAIITGETASLASMSREELLALLE